MPKPVVDADKAAKVLTEATLLGDAQAAEKYKVTLRTVRNYRKRLDEDESFSVCFTKHLSLFLGHAERAEQLEGIEQQTAYSAGSPRWNWRSPRWSVRQKRCGSRCAGSLDLTP